MAADLISLRSAFVEVTRPTVSLGCCLGRTRGVWPRILIAVAKAEQERKSTGQKLASEATAVNGKGRRHAAAVRVLR